MITRNQYATKSKQYFTSISKIQGLNQVKGKKLDLLQLKQAIGNKPLKQQQKQIDNQQCWIALNFQTILLPNTLFTQQNSKIYLKISLIQRNGLYFDYLQKAQPQELATIAHENVTDLNNQVTRIYEQILSMHSQHQDIKPNNFTTYEPIYQNCKISDFLGEKIIFNDSYQNINQRAHILIQVVELPSWKEMNEKTKAIGCFRVSNVQQLQNQWLPLQLYQLQNQNFNLSDHSAILNQICGQAQDLNNLDAPELLNIAQSIQEQQIQSCGIIQLKFKYLDEKEIIHARYVHDHPKYPYDREIDEQKYDIEADSSKQPTMQINTQNIQDEVKDMFDQLHYHSLRQGDNKIYDSNAKSKATFQTVSAIASPSQGNTALIAAAIQTPLQSFIICLFDQINMQLLSIIGYHSSYIYGLEFSNDNTQLISYSSDGCINIYDVRQYVFYGFNYFCEAHLPLEQFSQTVQSFKDNVLSGDMQNWLLNSVSSQNAQMYVQSSIYNDYQTLVQISTLYQTFENDLNKILQAADENIIYDLQQEHILTQIEVGIPVYSLTQINKAKGYQISKQLIYKNQLFQDNKINNLQPIRLVYGNLLGQVVQCDIQAKVNGQFTVKQTILVVHQSYVIKVLYLSKNLIIGEQNGKITFYSLQDNQVKVNFDIQTHQNLKDIEMIKTSNNSVIVTYSSNGNVSIFDTNGRLIANLNEQPQQQVKAKEHKLNIPGVQHLYPGRDHKYVLIPTYAGGVIAITGSCRIKKQFYCFGQEQYGHFGLCAVETKFGIISGFCSITQLGQKVVSQYVPQGIPTTGELPIVRIINEETIATSFPEEQEQGKEIDVSKSFLDGQGDFDAAIRTYMQFLQESKRQIE